MFYRIFKHHAGLYSFNVGSISIFWKQQMSQDIVKWPQAGVQEGGGLKIGLGENYCSMSVLSKMVPIAQMIIFSDFSES